MAFCPSCGAASQQDARFCVKCGRALAAGSDTEVGRREGEVTMRSLIEADSVDVAPILENVIVAILYQVGECPIRVSGPTGFAMLSFVAGRLDATSQDADLMLFCWDRRPREGVPSQQTAMVDIRRRSGTWRMGYQK